MTNFTEDWWKRRKILLNIVSEPVIAEQCWVIVQVRGNRRGLQCLTGHILVRDEWKRVRQAGQSGPVSAFKWVRGEDVQPDSTDSGGLLVEDRGGVRWGEVRWVMSGVQTRYMLGRARERSTATQSRSSQGSLVLLGSALTCEHFLSSTDLGECANPVILSW